MEDMGSYFEKWREWRNRDLGSKSFTLIKGAENDEVRDNQLIYRLNINQQILAFHKISTN